MVLPSVSPSLSPTIIGDDFTLPLDLGQFATIREHELKFLKLIQDERAVAIERALLLHKQSHRRDHDRICEMHMADLEETRTALDGMRSENARLRRRADKIVELQSNLEDMKKLVTLVSEEYKRSAVRASRETLSLLDQTRLLQEELRLLTEDLSLVQAERESLAMRSREDMDRLKGELQDLGQSLSTRTSERDEAMEEARKLEAKVRALNGSLRLTSEEMNLEIGRARGEKDQLDRETRAMAERLRVTSETLDSTRRKVNALEDILGHITEKIKNAGLLEDRNETSSLTDTMAIGDTPPLSEKKSPLVAEASLLEEVRALRAELVLFKPAARPAFVRESTHRHPDSPSRILVSAPIVQSVQSGMHRIVNDVDNQGGFRMFDAGRSLLADAPCGVRGPVEKSEHPGRPAENAVRGSASEAMPGPARTELHMTTDQSHSTRKTTQALDIERMILKTLAGYTSASTNVPRDSTIFDSSLTSPSQASPTNTNSIVDRHFPGGSTSFSPAMTIPLRLVSTSNRPDNRTPVDSEQFKLRTLAWPADSPLHDFANSAPGPSRAGPMPVSAAASVATSSHATSPATCDTFQAESASGISQLLTPEHSLVIAGPFSTALASTGYPVHEKSAHVRSMNSAPLTPYPSCATAPIQNTHEEQALVHAGSLPFTSAAGPLEQAVSLVSWCNYLKSRNDEQSKSELKELDARLRNLCKRWPGEEQAWRAEAMRRDGEQAVLLLRWCWYLRRREDEASKARLGELQSRLQVLVCMWPGRSMHWVAEANRRSDERRRANDAARGPAPVLVQRKRSASPTEIESRASSAKRMRTCVDDDAAASPEESLSQ